MRLTRRLQTASIVALALLLACAGPGAAAYGQVRDPRQAQYGETPEDRVPDEGGVLPDQESRDPGTTSDDTLSPRPDGGVEGSITSGSDDAGIEDAAGPPSPGGSDGGPSELPFTGLDAMIVGAIGVLMLAAGIGLRRLTVPGGRRPR